MNSPDAKQGLATGVRITLNGEEYAVQAAATVAELLAELGVGDRRVAVLCNGQVVGPAARADARLEPGARLELITLAGGG
jgi:sulfur carrier protein